jgi:hypothetical protein
MLIEYDALVADQRRAEEARNMPVLNDIMDNNAIGREFKRGMEQGRQEGRQEGELAFLRRLIKKRLPHPGWADERLATRSAAELEELGVRILSVENLEELLK